MTQETRETLAKLAEKFEHDHPYGVALRDALTPRTCSTCRWVRHLPDEQFIGETAPVCASEDESHPLHWCSPIGDAETFGCTSWQAREGEGGGK